MKFLVRIQTGFESIVKQRCKAKNLNSQLVCNISLQKTQLFNSIECLHKQKVLQAFSSCDFSENKIKMAFSQILAIRLWVKKLALNSQLLTVQILANDVQVLILCLSYFITTVNSFTNRLSNLQR